MSKGENQVIKGGELMKEVRELNILLFRRVSYGVVNFQKAT